MPRGAPWLEATTARMESHVGAGVIADQLQAACGKVIYRNGGGFCQTTRMLPPEYYSRQVEELAEKAIPMFVGADGSIIREGDENVVYCCETQKVLQNDYYCGSHILEFGSGMTTIAPIALAYDPRNDAEEYHVFAHNLLLLRGLAAQRAEDAFKCFRRGRTAKLLVLCCAGIHARRRAHGLEPR